MRWLAPILVAVLSFSLGEASAQSWPQRPVTFIVSQSAGASPDVMARMIANKLSISLVQCIGSISVLPITVNVKDVQALNDNDLTVLSNDLNKVSILDGGILNNDKILNDVEVSVLEDFLNKFLINVSKNDIDVCTTVLGILLCK